MFRHVTVLGFALCLLLGCRGSTEPETSSRDGEEFLRCAEPKTDGLVESFRLPPLTVARSGFDVDVNGIKRGLVVIGVIAGIFEPTESNFRNLTRFLEHFKAAGVQAIVVVGGLASGEKPLRAIIEHLRQAPVPILLVPGAEEHADVFHRTVADIRKAAPQVMDMIRVRRVRLGHVTLLSLPGYYQPFYLRAAERGCSFEPQDIEATLALMDDKRTNVLLSPTPPRGTGPHSVDRSRVGVNTGYDILSKELEKFGMQFGIFGHIYEAGGHATLGDGFTAVSEGIWQESLYLQAGAAEALPRSLVGEGAAVGMAHIVEISGARARYRSIHAGATGSWSQ